MLPEAQFNYVAAAQILDGQAVGATSPSLSTSFASGSIFIATAALATSFLAGSAFASAPALATDFRAGSQFAINMNLTTSFVGPVGATAYAQPGLKIGYENGVPMDFTLRIYLPQAEKATPFPTSPIKTTSAAVTREADVCSMDTSTQWFNNAEFMCYTEAEFDQLDNTTTQRIVAFDDGTTNELITFRAFNGLIGVVTVDGGAQQSNLTTVSSLVEGQYYRTMFRQKANDFAAKNVGESLQTDTSGTMPTVNKLRLGHNQSTPINFMQGYIMRVCVWPRGGVDSNIVDALAASSFPSGWAAPLSAKANTHFEGRCQSPTIERSIPIVPNSTLRSTLAIGNIVLANTDEHFDTIVQSDGIDGQSISIRLLNHPSNTYEQSTEIFKGIGAGWVAEQERLVIRLREKNYGLDVPLLTLFGGAGSGDGTAANAGRVIPQAYGLCRNITAELVDPAKLIFRFHDRLAQSVDAVYDRGNPITAGSAQSSYANLDAATVTAGTYDWALTANGSYFRLGSSPSGSVTADVKGDALGGYTATAAGILRRILLRSASTDNINSSTFESYAASLPAVCGVYFTAQTTINEAVNAVANGTFMTIGDFGDGLLSIYRLVVSSSNSGIELNEYNIVGNIEQLELPDIINPCVWRLRLAYRNNWTPLVGNDIVPAPTILESRRQELRDPFKIVTDFDSARRNKNTLAIDLPIYRTLLDEEADADTLASNMLSLYQQNRQLLQVPVGIAAYGLRLGQTVRIVWPRFNLDSGKLFTIVGMAHNGHVTILTVFG